jgi:hypothetical protein
MRTDRSFFNNSSVLSLAKQQQQNKVKVMKTAGKNYRARERHKIGTKKAQGI